jgi:DNA-binding transcriptional ArsR family regulator
VQAERTATPIDLRVVKALGHPLRQRILQHLNEHGEASPAQLAKALDVPLGSVAYHVKVLSGCEAIELSRTVPVRGAIEHFYRASALPRLDQGEWEKLPASARKSLFDQTLRQIFDHAAAAARGNAFEDPRSHASWAPLALDEKAHEALLAKIDSLLDEALALQAQGQERLRKLPAEERRVHEVELAMLYFHRTQPQS